ncbi:MAG: PEP-CTERM system histidine kinase PrsK, partial [Opitutaceae bacterium]|nr:PEP-CTERM system histidine kinase PrsK [Verrucomicrobiales bacterium]
ILLAAEGLLDQKAAEAQGEFELMTWLTRAMLLKSFSPLFWLTFSLTYARGNRAEFIRGWKWILVVALLLPAAISMGVAGQALESSLEGDWVTVRFLTAGKIWLVLVVVLTLGVLVNLEKTFRASVGMTRWRIKYLFLGMALILGVKIYSLSQLLLFSKYDPALASVASLGVILGCGLIAIGHFRSGFGAIDLYPSRALLQGSLTVVFAGGYFLIVGVLAQVVATLGGIASFPAQALVVLVGLVGLTILLLSDRFRTSLQRFVSRHFRRAEHDFRKIWTEFTRRTSSVFDEVKLGKHAAEVISENFHVLGVTVFQVVSEPPALIWLSTPEMQRDHSQLAFNADWLSGIERLERPFNLEEKQDAWANLLRESCPTKFEHGGDRLVIPLVAAERLVGLVILADRVNGVPYSHEEIDLLACMGDQLAAALLSCSLTEKVLQAKELEAFQTLSTFFVHDLKNAANSLNLTLQNLPVHFDDPEFRADAVKAVGRTVERINQMILNLSRLRHELQLRRGPCRLDLLCSEVLDNLGPEMKTGCIIQRDLQVVPELHLDREAMHSVVTNLVVNAQEAMTDDGNIRVSTRLENGRLALTVADEGSGMSAEFIKNHLFRPFHSTKTKGLGIGMFQCKKIVEAHQGSIGVDSAPGQGTRFTISIPTVPEFSPASIP